MKKGILGKILFACLTLALLIPAALGCSSSSSGTSATANQTTKTTTQATTATTTASVTTTATTTTAAQHEVRIGVMGGMTGPAAQAIVPMFKEYENMFKYINEVEGGIEGAKLVWKFVDNKGTPDGAIQAYKELRDTFQPTIYLAVEDYYLAGAKATIEADKSTIITTSAMMGALFAPPGRFFCTTAPTADTVGGYVNYIKQNWKGTGNPKLGILYWDLPSGMAWKAAETWVKGQGVDIVPVSYPYATLDFKPQLMQLRDAKVDYVYGMTNVQQNSVIVRDYRSLGLTFPLCFCEMGSATDLLAIVSDQAEGFYELRYESPAADNSEAAQLYSAIEKWANGKEKWSDNRLQINFKAILAAGVKQAVADVGWDKLDNEAIYQALNKLTTIDTWGNCSAFGYGPDKRIGTSTIKVKQYTKTGTVSVSDWVPMPDIFAKAALAAASATK
jgi:branched-chain amino acid transport system substrate-binding protein